MLLVVGLRIDVGFLHLIVSSYSATSLHTYIHTHPCAYETQKVADERQSQRLDGKAERSSHTYQFLSGHGTTLTRPYSQTRINSMPNTNKDGYSSIT